MKLTTITDLHEHVIHHIFCFLSAKFVIRCSCVCKDWAELIYQPYFPHLYFSQGKAPLQLLFKGYKYIVLAQLDESLFTSGAPLISSVPENSIFKLNIRQIFGYPNSNCLKIWICHVTGWILALGDKHPYSKYHMYNPITGQHLVVQQPNRDDSRCESCALIFCQKTNKLKLLEFCYNKRGRAEIYVQTIGTNSWKSIGEVNCFQFHYTTKQAVLSNGHYHWLDPCSLVIHSLNTEEVVFDVIQTPSRFEKFTPAKLGILDGCLCLTTPTTNHYHSEVWVMNEYGIQDSWVKKFVVNFPDVEPLTYLKNGEILMLEDHCQGCKEALICYDPRTENFSFININ